MIVPDWRSKRSVGYPAGRDARHCKPRDYWVNTVFLELDLFWKRQILVTRSEWRGSGHEGGAHLPFLTCLESTHDRERLMPADFAAQRVRRTAAAGNMTGYLSCSWC
jgi:hypothetical protein